MNHCFVEENNTVYEIDMDCLQEKNSTHEKSNSYHVTSCSRRGACMDISGILIALIFLNPQRRLDKKRPRTGCR